MSNQITLILGAGASMDYGYPSGARLIEHIVSMSLHQYIPNDHNRDIANNWQTELRKAQTDSIDHYMSHRPEISENLRPLMILKILEFENANDLFILGRDHWYKHFFSPLITNNIKQTEQNLSQVKIITFNYDRSLEYYLMSMIKSRNQISEAEAFKALSSLEIIHVYGRIHDFPEESNMNEIKIPYSPKRIPLIDIYESAVRLAKNSIKTCYETSNQSEKCNKALSEAENILFLGFGYHKENIKTLNFNFKDLKNKKIMGTILGLDNKIITGLREDFPTASLFATDNLSLLKDYYEFKENGKHNLR